MHWATSVAKSLHIAVPVFGNPVVDGTSPLSAPLTLLALINGALGNDAQTIANKVTAALYYESQVAANNLSLSTSAAKAAISAVTFDPATVFASEASANALVRSSGHAVAAMSLAPVSAMPSIGGAGQGIV